MRELLQIRRQEIVPRLAGAAFGEARAGDDGLLTAHWRMGDGATLRLARQPVRPSPSIMRPRMPAGTLIWGSELGDSVPPWTVLWRIG